jgi:hypothetical protein
VLRTVWLGLGCLICIGGVFLLKITFGMPTKLETTATEPNIVANIDFGPAPKADRLDVSYVEDAPDKIFVKPIAIVPQKTDVSSSDTLTTTEPVTPAETITKIVSRHWHQGFAKMSRGSAHKLRFVSRTKPRS